MGEEIEESFDDSKSQKTLKDKKKMGSRTSLDQHKLGGNKKKSGLIQSHINTKERGRQSLFKKTGNLSRCIFIIIVA